MGFKIPDRNIILEGFEDDFAALEVTCTRNVTLAEYLQLQAAQQEERMEDLFQSFGDHILMKWNVEDKDGVAVAATGAGLLTIPADVSGLIVRAWLQAVVDIPAPLEQPSQNGANKSQEIPMPLHLGDMSSPNS